MALSAGTVSIGVKPDTSKFGPELKTGLTGGMAGVGEGLGANLGKKLLAGLGVVGIASAIGGAIKTGFGELMDASAGTAQLAAGLKSTGNAANVTVDGLNNLASSIQNYSGQTDDSIVKSEQLLLTFTNIKNSGPDKIFDMATKATADMAAKMGGDASASAIQLGKALNDPVKGITALSRVGVSFTEQQKAQIKSMVAHNDVIGAQKIILGELNKEFGGSAAAYGKSLPGMIDRMKRSWEDLTQTLATMLLPIINPILTGLLNLFQLVQPHVQAFADKMSGFFSKMASGGLSFQGILTSLTSGVSNFLSGGGLIKIIEGFTELRTKIINALLDLLPTIISQLAGAVVKLLPQLVQSLLSMIPQLMQTAQKLFSALITALGVILPSLLNAIVAMLPKLINSIVSMLPGIIDGALKLFTGLINGLIVVIPKLLTSLLDALPKILAALISMLPALIAGAIKLFVGIVTALIQATPQIVKAVAALIPVIVKTIIQLLPLIIDAGVQIVKGLVKGIMDNAPALIGAAVKGLGSMLVDGVKAVLGIHSPSVVFHGIGKNVSEGMGNGIADGAGSVLATAGRVAADLVDRVREHLTTLRDAAAKAVDDAKKTLTDYAASVKDALSGGINFASALSDEDQAKADAEKSGGTFGGSFIASLQSQADKAVKFTDQVKQLVAGGLSKDALQQVLSAGADAGTRIAQELLTGGSTTIKKANDLIEASKAAAAAAADASANAYYEAGVKNAESQLAGYNATLAKMPSSIASKVPTVTKAASNTTSADRAAALTASVAAPTIIYNAAKNDSISSEQKLVDAVNRAAVLARTGGL
jgi:hypothetical protein